MAIFRIWRSMASSFNHVSSVVTFPGTLLNCPEFCARSQHSCSTSLSGFLRPWTPGPPLNFHPSHYFSFVSVSVKMHFMVSLNGNTIFISLLFIFLASIYYCTLSHAGLTDWVTNCTVRYKNRRKKTLYL